MLNYSDRSNLFNLYEYSTNVIQVVGKPDTWLSPKEGNVNLFGVELEVSTDYEVKHVINAFPEIFAICKKDSTITGSKANKFEIVTIPGSLKKHKKMWASFFKNLSTEKFDTLDRHTNGMHVHISRDSFEPDNIHLKKFAWFFSSPSMQDFNLSISERTKDSLDKYSKFATKATSIANVERHTRELTKYAVVNLTKSDTIEVRLFKGIVSFASVIKNLEYVDAAIEYTRNVGFTQINLNDFLDWLHSLPTSRYRTLRLCLEEIDIEDIHFNSNLTELLKAKDVKQVFKKIQSGQFKFDGAKYTKRVISQFNDAFPGWKLIGNTTKGWELLQITTKFAKLDNQILNLLGR